MCYTPIKTLFSITYSPLIVLGNSKRYVTLCSSFLPREASYKIFFPKNLIHYLPQIMDFMVVDGDEYHAIISEEIASEVKTGIHHREPVRVVPTIGFCILYETIAVTISLSCRFLIPRPITREVITIDEIFPRIIRRVDIDHFHLFRVSFLEEFEDFEIVSLDENILGIFEIHTCGRIREECLGRRGEYLSARVTLACPRHPVCLFFI